MMKTSKWLKLGAVLFGGAMLFSSGCMGGFFGDVWQGFWNTGWPADSRWINIGLDILNEELFG